MTSGNVTHVTATGRGRASQAAALVPLSVVSVAATVAIAGAGSAGPGVGSLPDGTSVPSQAITAPASVSSTGGTARAASRRSVDLVPTVATSAIPALALSAYQNAEAVIDAADRSCHLPWQLVAAIGRVESDHGRADGNRFSARGVARPGLFGPELDGTGGTPRIADTDDGRYDSDRRWDRAAGPLQFIPSTWSVVGVDADGDQERNPQDIDDAALGAAVYLCSGDDDLGTDRGRRAAVSRYNQSPTYVDLVLSIMDAYLAGDFTTVPNLVVPAGYLLPAPVTGAPTAPGGGPGGGPHQPGQPGQPGQQPTAAPTQQPSAAPTQQPSAAPTQQPSQQPTPSGTPSPSSPSLPTITLPTLPSTSVTPVDQLLTHAQAVLQCTLDGYVDNPLRSDDPFDRCVYDYMHRG